MTQDLAKHKNWPEKLKEMTIGAKIAVVVSFIFLWGIFSGTWCRSRPHGKWAVLRNRTFTQTGR